jgi:PAS domain S-box-containing protein
MKTKSVMRGKLQLAFGSAILVLLVVGGIAFRTAAVAGESDRWVRHTQEVLENIADLLSTMQNLESSARGFILTGKEPYLETYRACVAHSQVQMTLVRNLTLDNPAQQRQIPILENLAAQKIQLAERVIAVRRAEGLQTAVDATLNGGGQQIMDAYREVIREMQEEEQRLLVLRDADSERRLGQTKTILILGTFLGVLIATLAGWVAHRDSVARGLAEAALRDSEDKYRRLIQGVQDYAILMLGPQGEIRSWNPGAERMTGCKFEEVAGQNYSRFFPPEDVKLGRPKEILRIAAASGSYEEQGMRLRKNGARFLVRTTYTSSRDVAGNLRGFSVISRDLSQGAESDAKYRGLLEAAPDAMVVVNQSGEIMLLNVQAEKQFGYSRDELIGQKVKNIIPDGFAERLIADGTRSAADALAQQIGTGIELIARRKNGTEFPIEIMLSPLESAEGTLVTAAIRDITTRKDAEKHLAQMEGRYRGLLEAAPDAMVVVNQGGEIVLLNVQAEKQFGYRRDELVGQKVKNIIPEGFAERLIADGTRSAADALAQQIGTGIELIARRKNRSEFPIEIMLSPLESSEGTLVTAAIRDISVRRAAEKHLAQMEGRYRGLLEAAPDAMVVVNQSGAIVLLNLQAEKQFGYSRDELRKHWRSRLEQVSS